ncbi:MAG TPA: hypothetical protein VH478_17870 [Trebonia sp.]|nr:hypothetical protein [Trebonia sp.]
MLRLEAGEFRDLTRWRWTLADADGAGEILAGHDVRLDRACWQFEAFADLPFYVRWHAAPDRRRADEARIVAEIGEWIGSQVLGPVAAELARRGPSVVRVVVPPEASDLLLRPLELAHANGRPLSVEGSMLVMAAGSAGPAAPAGERLRVLGLFSLPEGGRARRPRPP